MTQQLIPIGAIARWRGETVRVVSLRGDKAQIARPGIGLRWVRLDALDVREP